MSKRARRWLVAVGVIFALLAAALGALVLALRHPRPEGGVAGPEADGRARAVEAAVDKAAWDRTGAVRFTFHNRHHYLWDRARNLARVRFGDTEVLLDLHRKDGKSRRNGGLLEGEAHRKAVTRAYAYFINDTFWLNPLAKLFDDGVTRLALEHEGGPALLVQYHSGGLTPGDAYLWILGDDKLPRAWRMYVSILPIAGVEATWESWTTLPTGARIATRHRILGRSVAPIDDLAGAATLAELEPGSDPFAPLVSKSPPPLGK